MLINSLSWTCDNPHVIVNRRYSKMSPEVKRFCSTFVDYYLVVPCGRCALCKERKSKAWRFRLSVESDSVPKHYMFGNNLPRIMFVTLTFDDKKIGNIDDYDFAPYFVKFRDNFRKCFGNSPRYFAITDRGSQFGRLHLHMLLFNPIIVDKKTKKEIGKVSVSMLHAKNMWWPYGFTDVQWVENPDVSSYVCGYITGANMDREIPIKHGKPICERALRYNPKVYVSKGLGKQFLTEENMEYIYSHNSHVVTYNGYYYALPRYYTNYIYTAEERFENGLVRQFEIYDYIQRIRFDQNRVEYDYKGIPISRSRLLEHIEHREKFTSPAKPRYSFIGFPTDENFLNEFEFDVSHYVLDDGDVLTDYCPF